MEAGWSTSTYDAMRMLDDPGVHGLGLGDGDRIANIEPTLMEATDENEEMISHLVQDEEVIAELHDCVLPPDQYYEALSELWKEWWPKANPDLLEHMMSVLITFELCFFLFRVDCFRPRRSKKFYRPFHFPRLRLACEQKGLGLVPFGTNQTKDPSEASQAIRQAMRTHAS